MDIIKHFIKYVDINTTNDVIKFFLDLHIVAKCNFHPDDTFEEYVNSNGEGYTEEECTLLEGIMNKCFDYCETRGEDIYELALRTYIARIINIK